MMTGTGKKYEKNILKKNEKLEAYTHIYIYMPTGKI